MLKSILVLVGAMIGFHCFAQSSGIEYLDPVRAVSRNDATWYLYQKNSTDDSGAVIRSLADNWVIGKLKKDDTYTDLYVTNNQWKWSSKTRAISGKAARSKQEYLLLFTKLPGELPPEARIFLEYDAAILLSSKKDINRQWLDHPDLIWLDSHTKPTEESILRRHDLSVNDVYLTHHLHGSSYGVTTSIKEQRFRKEDLDIFRISDTTERSFPAVSSHATDMATLVSGKGVSFLYGTGVSNGHLISTSYDLLFPEPSSYFDAYDCEVQNHSFGVGVENYYGAEAKAYDEMAFASPDVLHVFSSGNSGEFTALDGNYAGLLQTSNLTGTFKQAKNVLIVGATDSLNNVKPYSSVGPTYDGRVKPELVAYGGEGSSDAAALVSGMASYLKGFASNEKGKLLSAAETKALLMAGAKDLGEDGPDYRSGYGSASLQNSLNILRKEYFFSDSVLNEEKRHTVRLAEPASYLKVILYWNDPSSLLDANHTLINDLNLTLTDPNGLEFKPWILSTFPNADSLNLAAKRGVDHVNNVEMISIADLQPGDYTVRITTEEGLNAPQLYTIAYQIKEKDHFEWKYPTSSDHLIFDEPTILRWNSTLEKDAVGRLLWQWSDSTTVLLAEEVIIADEQVGIYVPDSLGAGHWILEIEGIRYMSENVWIESVPQLDVSLNCEDRLILTWEGDPLIDQTLLFNPELQTHPTNENDTSLILDPSQLSSDFIAIRHTYQDKLGIRSYAINYKQQGTGCYLSSFIARQTEERSVTLDLKLNAIDLIRSVSVEKTSSTETTIPFDIPNPSESILIEDQDLVTGIYEYSVILDLKDGTQLRSDAQTIYYANKSSTLIFPNPVSPSSELAVMSDASGGVFQLIDLNGRLSLQWDISNTIEYIPLYGIRQGVYSFQVISDEKVLKRGKVLVK
ncbi:MAG: S8 family peptidase [Cyclobacteriaceae bacterium]